MMSGEAPEGESKNGSSTRFNITISERTTEKLADVVVDLFKPASQALGMLGDWVENRRGEMQAVRTLRKAQRIAAETGKVLEEPPPKFFIPYLRGASLEDPHDSDIQEKWANLLVNAGARPNSIAFFAASVLEKISSDEVAFLDAFVERSQVLHFETYEEFCDAQNADYESCGKLAERGVGFVKEGRLQSDDAIAAILEQFQRYNRIRVTIILLSDHDPRAADPQFEANWSDPELRGSVFLMLDSRNIFARGHWKTSGQNKSYNYANMGFLTFSELGFDFVKKIYRTKV